MVEGNRFRVMDHMSDIGIEAFGVSLEECFENAARGMFQLIAPNVTALDIIRREVEVEAPDIEGLLVAWLSELIYLFDSEGLLPGKYEVIRVLGKHLSAIIWGETIANVPAVCQMEIKAVTYHLLQVTHISPAKDGGYAWKARVIFDV